MVNLRHRGLYLLEHRRVTAGTDAMNLDSHACVLACTVFIALSVVAFREACIERVADLGEQALAQAFSTLDEQRDLSGVLVLPGRVHVVVREGHKGLVEARLQLRAAFIRSSNLNLGS